jgi:hypothetical protein
MPARDHGVRPASAPTLDGFTVRRLRRRVGAAQENRCAFDRRSVVAVTLRGSREHIAGDLETRGA